VLAQVMQTRLNRRLRLITRLAGGHSVITCDITGMKDLTGMRDEEMLPDSSVPVMLRYHQQRVAERGGQVVQYQPQSVVDDLFTEQRAWAAALVRAGYANFLTPDQNTFRHSAKGAWELTKNTMRGMRTISEQNEKAKARNKAWKERHGG
jgi:hypothetical protein